MQHTPQIVHYDLDSFFVSVEVLLNPSLKGKPVIVGGTSDRGVVSTCSYEARRLGIHSAMPMRTAMRLCPHAIVLQGTINQYSHYSKMVTDIIADSVPLFEKASIDEFYCDLTGMDKFIGSEKFARELRDKIIKDTGLPISGGLSTARFISKIATNEAKPNGFLAVQPGREKEFLWPLPIEKINGVGKNTEQKLKDFGLYTIKDIAHTDKAFLENIIGKWGESLWRKSQGQGSATITTEWDQKSMSHETTFHQNISSIQQLEKHLVWLTEKCGFDLRKSHKLTGCITVKIRYPDFEIFSRQEIISYTSLDDIILEKVKSIFHKLYNKTQPVRLLGVRLSHLAPHSLQMNLFNDNQKKYQLYETVDSIKQRFGKQLIQKATNAAAPSKKSSKPQG